ncbi:MAG TPA: cation-transporting P-type ATPase, partial [Candidatus Eisenbacteria bacterium]
NVVLAGTSLAAGEARVVVFATGMGTEFGRIARLTQTAEPAESPLLREIRALSRLVAVLATSLGVVFFFIGRSAGLSFWETFIFAIGIIVANVPEGLLPTITMSLSLGAQRMARRNALIRHLPSVETLGSATVICTDKTGTLTLNRMSARRLYVGGASRSLPFDLPTLDRAHHRFFDVARSCQNLKRGHDGWIGDPLEVSLVSLAEEALPGSPELERVDVIPFDSDRRRLSTLHRLPDGLVLYTKGALESLLPLCARVELEQGDSELDEPARKRLLDAENAMAGEGLRVIALAMRPVREGEPREALEQSLTLLGLAGFEDPPRPEVPAALQRCHEAGIRVIMVTGDHPTTATAIAREIGLNAGRPSRVLTGREVERLSDTQLRLALRVPDLLFARVTADQKMRIVRALRVDGEIVAVTGDGVNDAPALKLAHIGIAMGVTGTDVARESADMILLDDNFASIVHAIEEGRGVYENIRRFLTYILTSNIPELIPYLAFALFRIPLPLTIIQILAVDLGTDMVPALGLGIERPSADLMKRPPRARSERLLSPGLLGRAYLILGPLEAIAAMAAYFFVLRGGGWSWGTTLASNDLLYLQSTTACLSAIVVMQIVNVYLCRDSRASFLSAPLFGNRLIVAGIASEIVGILLIVYTPFGNALFRTAPIGAGVWLFILPFALAMILVEEGRKAFVRRSRSGRGTALSAARG